MTFSPSGLNAHVAKLSKEILSHPLVSFAMQVYAAFNTDDFGKFLRLYRSADFLTAVAMSGVADLARLRALWLLVRTYPQPIGDKISLARIMTFLAFKSQQHARTFLLHHGMQIKDDPKADGGAFIVLPKKGTPEAASHPILTGPAKLPDTCTFPKGGDSMLVFKYNDCGFSRADIVFGHADPVAPEVVVVEEPAVLEEGAPAEAEASTAAMSVDDEASSAGPAAAAGGEAATGASEAAKAGEGEAAPADAAASAAASSVPPAAAASAAEQAAPGPGSEGSGSKATAAADGATAAAAAEAKEGVRSEAASKPAAAGASNAPVAPTPLEVVS